jgi:uncharacterized membrane protein
VFDPFFSALLIAHITSGVISLGAAGVALASDKGTHMHRRSGRIYVTAMLSVSISALLLALQAMNGFLLMVSVFTFYLIFTGWRAATARNGTESRFDRAVGIGVTLVGIGMVGRGALLLSSGITHPSITLIVFGMISTVMPIMDWRHWARGPIVGRSRIARHLSRMLGGTIATLTATAVVNLDHWPAMVVWLGPTALLTPVILWWIKRLNGSSQTS